MARDIRKESEDDIVEKSQPASSHIEETILLCALAWSASYLGGGEEFVGHLAARLALRVREALRQAALQLDRKG